MRSGKAATSARGGALHVRRTSTPLTGFAGCKDSTAAGAHQGLLNAPGIHGGTR